MERLATLPAVNGAAAAILIATAAAQFHLIPPQQGRQWDALLEGRKIHPGLHNCLWCLSRWCGSARFGAHRNGPNESQQFAADGGYNLWLVLPPCGQLLVATAQSPLRLPGDGFGPLIQTLLPLGQPASDPRFVLVGPGRFYHHPSKVCVAR